MAEDAVLFLVEKLATQLEEEVKHLTGFWEEVEYVRDEFERMKAFLRVADAVEDADEDIKVWVKQVREVAYDTEDLIDEFLYHFEHPRRHGFHGYLCKIGHTIKTLKARCRINTEMKRIRRRITNISESHQRYGYKLEDTQRGSSSTTRRSNTLHELRSDARLLDEAQLVGLDKPKQHLLNFLVEDISGLRVVAVVGMGGLGKTTLVSKVYSDLQVKKHFQHHAWVTVSQSVKLDELLRQLVQQLYDEDHKKVPDEVTNKSADNTSLKRIIADFLRGKRYLIVLDDIWSLDPWDALKVAFPDSNNDSRLMITTRTTQVASSSTKELGGTIYPLMPLSSEESWTLFCAKAFQGNSCPPDLKTISQHILKRCEGLPLAIVAIGGMLATKDNKIYEWDMVYRCLRAELEENTKLKNMQEILLLSFNDLPCNLKHCFMYLSIFPEDHLINRNILIRLWMAEGFLPEIEGRTLEEVGQGYFNELLNRSLIQVGDRYGDDRIRSCRVHDFLRQIILLKSKDQNFVAIANEENKRLPERVRRLSIHKGKMMDEYRNNDFSRLRSLLLILEEVESVSSNFLRSFFDCGLRLLRVMDCRGAPLSIFPEDITKLYNLRYLSLRDTDIKSIPHSIGKLWHLETLDLKNTFVEELPSEILQLQCLRQLIIYRYGSKSPTGIPQGFKAFEGMETLSSLRKLLFVDATQGGADFLVSIGRLTQLTRLGILQLEAQLGHAVCSSIGKLKYLRSLTLETRTEDHVLNLQFTSFSPPQFLQRLYIIARLEMLPHWLLNLTNVTTILFKASRFQVDPLETLQALPSLVVLNLERAYDGEALCFKAGGFPMLTYFQLFQADNLTRVTVEDGSLPHIEEIHLEDCKLLKEIPSGLERLRNLQCLGLVDMAEELINTLYPESQHANYLKVMHVPFVYTGPALRLF